MAPLDPDAARPRHARGCILHGEGAARGALTGGRGGAHHRRNKDDRLALDEEAASQRKRPHPPPAILEVHVAGVDEHDGSDESAALQTVSVETSSGQLDHEVALGRHLGHDTAPDRAPVAGEHVIAVSIAVSHDATVRGVAGGRTAPRRYRYSGLVEGR